MGPAGQHGPDSTRWLTREPNPQPAWVAGLCAAEVSPPLLLIAVATADPEFPTGFCRRLSPAGDAGVGRPHPVPLSAIDSFCQHLRFIRALFAGGTTCYPNQAGTFEEELQQSTPSLRANSLVLGGCFRIAVCRLPDTPSAYQPYTPGSDNHLSVREVSPAKPTLGNGPDA